jgi:phosphate transport system substrate-binding protein
MPFFLAALAALSACASEPPPAGVEAPAPLEPAEGTITIAGTGAMTALAEALAEAWNVRASPLRVLVEPSVGSGASVRAVEDGAVDLGMISRPLTREESRAEVELVIVARDAVIFAANPSAGVTGLTSAQLVDIHLGKMTRWPNGERVRLFLRDREESANAVMEELVPALRDAREAAYQERRFPVDFHDDHQAASLAVTRGAIGLVGLATIGARKLPLVPLALDGVAPSVETMERWEWKAHRDLAFVCRKERCERSAGFVAFAQSEEGARIARQAGYLPLRQGKRP